MLGRFSLGLVSTLALMNGAEAADFYAVGEQSLKDTPIYAMNTWTGFYAGVHLGAAVSNLQITDPYGRSIYGDSVLTSGGLAGGQIGYNYQLGKIVIGAEADASWTNLEGSNTCFAYSGDYLSANCHAHADALGSFTGRIGTAFGPNDRTLVYVKGGGAWENVGVDAKVNGGDTEAIGPANATSSNAIRWGWTVGVGVEHALTSNWSVKAEYDYADFGSNGMMAPESISGTGGRGVQPIPGHAGHGGGSGGGADAVPGASSSVFQDLHEFKVGLNYKFGAGLAAWGDDASSVKDLSASVKDIPAAFVPATEVEFGTRYAGSWGRFQKDWGMQGLPVSALRSRLTYSDMIANGGELFARIDTAQNIMIKGYAGLGSGDGGRMHDEDWNISFQSAGRRPPTDIPYSNTVSNTGEDIKYGVIDAGYDIFRNSDYRVAPFVGYSFLAQNMKALGCAQLANPDSDCATVIPVSTVVITERDTWQALRVGVAADVMPLPRWKLSVDAAYLPYVSFDGTDNHVLRALVSPETGNGVGAQVEASLSYALTNNWSLGVGARYLTEWTTSAKLNYGGAGTLLPAKMAVEQATGFAQVSYKFGLSGDSLDSAGEPGGFKDGPSLPAAAWTGPYAGINGGGALGQDPGSVTISDAKGVAAVPGSQPSGAFGGGQIGYNWQGAPFLGLGGSFVAGLEADIQGSGLYDSIAFLPSPLGATSARSSKGSVDYFGTARVRLGYAVDDALLYATGGFAYGGVNDKVRNANGEVIYTNDGNAEPGYAVGAGLEYKINPNWSIKAEYQYISLGGFDLRDPIDATAHARDAEVDFHTVRLGLNYHLDDALPCLK